MVEHHVRGMLRRVWGIVIKPHLRQASTSRHLKQTNQLGVHGREHRSNSQWWHQAADVWASPWRDRQRQTTDVTFLPRPVQVFDSWGHETSPGAPDPTGTTGQAVVPGLPGPGPYILPTGGIPTGAGQTHPTFPTLPRTLPGQPWRTQNQGVAIPKPHGQARVPRGAMPSRRRASQSQARPRQPDPFPFIQWDDSPGVRQTTGSDSQGLNYRALDWRLLG